MGGQFSPILGKGIQRREAKNKIRKETKIGSEKNFYYRISWKDQHSREVSDVPIYLVILASFLKEIEGGTGERYAPEIFRRMV
jgi:hypothetical protein